MEKGNKDDFLSKSWQEKRWNIAINAAGPRYTQELNVELPIVDVFNGLARNKEYYQNITDLREAIEKELWFIKGSKNRHKKNSLIRNRLMRLSKLSVFCMRWLLKIETSRSRRKYDIKTIDDAVKAKDPDAEPFQKFLREEEERDYREWKERREKMTQPDVFSDYSASEDVRELQSLNSHIRRLTGALENATYFLNRNITKLVNHPFLLVLGRSGVGKTHLLCDIAKRRIQEGKLTYIVLGEEISDITDLLEDITASLKVPTTSSKFLAKINRWGKSRKERAIIIIDAINEGDKEGFKRNLNEFINKLDRYPWIGVVLSCRIPFENISIPNNAKIVKEEHYGFAELELEAMRVFFNFYKLPLPEVPLLVAEFSSPLFLGSFCKTAQAMKDGKKEVAKSIRELAMGQKGMTTILEDFYKAKQKLIIKANKKDRILSGMLHDGWLWKNGDCIAKLFAKTMAIKRENYLNHEETLDVIGEYFNNSNRKTHLRLLRILIEFGVVIEDLTWNGTDKTYTKIIKFSFHKFSDHLIARYLLAEYLKPIHARKSVLDDKYLGPLFKDELSVSKHADLVEAVFVEFPERLKAFPKYHNKDLIDYLDKELANSYIIKEIYVRSLYWRSPDNFLNSSGELKLSIQKYCSEVLLRYEPSASEFLNLFITTSLKAKHILNAKRLDLFLKKMTMQARDSFWSEFIRKQYASSSIYRLVDWIEHSEMKVIDIEQAEMCIITLAWLLGTTNRHLRDRVTKCIYLIGRIQPKVCFDTTLYFLSCNDPYITERMMASSYGVCMAIHRNSTHKETVNTFATSIFKTFFKRGSRYSTTHALTRGYARGIVEICQWHNAGFLNQKEIHLIRPPYSYGGIRKWGQCADKNKGEYRDGNSPLGMDFENYSIGRLVKGRHNYDFDNKEYIKVKENILWRIYQLGYSFEAFGDIDKEIARNNSYQGMREDEYQKIDRYGKKYSLIAYFELAGLRMDKKMVESVYFDEDGRGEEDLDPAFPVLKNDPQVIDRDFINGSKDLKQWLENTKKPKIKDYLIVENLKKEKGPWVLVNGFMDQVDKINERKIGFLFEGMFISDEHHSTIRRILSSKKYPGNSTIPRLPDLDNTFAGEIDWRDQRLATPPEDPVFIQKLIGYKRVRNDIRISILGEDLTKTSPRYWRTPLYDDLPIKLPSRYYHTKDYGKPEYEKIGRYIPSADIINILKLEARPDTLDMYCSDGSIGTISIYYGKQFNTHQNLLFIRKDLIEQLEKYYNKSFYWFVWGERNHMPKDTSNYHREDLRDIYQKYKNVHRQFISLKGNT